MVFGFDAVRIPFINRIIGFAEFIRLTIRELESLIGIFHFQFSLGLHTINSLIIKHTTIILKESPILTTNINQHRRKTGATGTTFAPQSRLRTSGISVTATTRIAGINRSQSSTYSITTGADIIIQFVTTGETFIVCPCYPVSRPVISIRGSQEVGSSTGREGKAGRYSTSSTSIPSFSQANNARSEKQIGNEYFNKPFIRY